MAHHLRAVLFMIWVITLDIHAMSARDHALQSAVSNDPEVDPSYDSAANGSPVSTVSDPLPAEFDLKSPPLDRDADVYYQVSTLIPSYPRTGETDPDSAKKFLEENMMDDDYFFQLRKEEDLAGLRLRSDVEVLQVAGRLLPDLFQAVYYISGHVSHYFAIVDRSVEKSFAEALSKYLDKYAKFPDELPNIQSDTTLLQNPQDLQNIIIYAWFNVGIAKQCKVRGNEIDRLLENKFLEGCMGVLWDVLDREKCLRSKMNKGQKIREHLLEQQRRISECDSFQSCNEHLRNVFGVFYVLMSKTQALKEFVALLYDFLPEKLMVNMFPNLSAWKKWEQSWNIPLHQPWGPLIAAPSNWAGLNFALLPGMNPTAGEGGSGWIPARSWQNPHEPGHSWSKTAVVPQFKTVQEDGRDVLLALDMEGPMENGTSDVLNICSKICDDLWKGSGSDEWIHVTACKYRETGGAYSYKLNWAANSIIGQSSGGARESIASPMLMMRLAGAPEIAGPSGTTADVMMFPFLLCNPTRHHARMLRRAMVAWLVPMRDHSIVEVLLGAEPFMHEDDRVFQDCEKGLLLKAEVDAADGDVAGAVAKKGTPESMTAFHELMLGVVEHGSNPKFPLEAGIARRGHADRVLVRWEDPRWAKDKAQKRYEESRETAIHDANATGTRQSL